MPLTFAYSKDTPTELVTNGPYRWIRHPFYTAYTLCFSAIPCATFNPWLALGSLFMFVVYLRSALMEERKFANCELADKYRSYSTLTGRFLPIPWHPFGARQ